MGIACVAPSHAPTPAPTHAPAHLRIFDIGIIQLHDVLRLLRGGELPGLYRTPVRSAPEAPRGMCTWRLSALAHAAAHTHPPTATGASPARRRHIDAHQHPAFKQIVDLPIRDPHQKPQKLTFTRVRGHAPTDTPKARPTPTRTATHSQTNMVQEAAWRRHRRGHSAVPQGTGPSARAAVDEWRHGQSHGTDSHAHASFPLHRGRHAHRAHRVLPFACRVSNFPRIFRVAKTRGPEGYSIQPPVHHRDSHRDPAWRPIPQPRQTGSLGGHGAGRGAEKSTKGRYGTAT